MGADPEFIPNQEEYDLGIANYIRLLGRRRCEQIAAQAINDAFTEALENIPMNSRGQDVPASLDEQETEKRLQAKGLNAPRLTPDLIDATIAEEDYHVFPGTTLTVCCLTLKNGYTVTGESAAASPANFDAAEGKRIARRNARDKIWALEGYLLREKIHLGQM